MKYKEKHPKTTVNDSFNAIVQLAENIFDDIQNAWIIDYFPNPYRIKFDISNPQNYEKQFIVEDSELLIEQALLFLENHDNINILTDNSNVPRIYPPDWSEKTMNFI